MRLGVAAAVVGRELVRGDVEVESGMVSAIGLESGEPGMVAVPGFVDVHFHGYSGIEFANATDSQHADLAREITATGVTAYQPTLWTMPIEEMESALSRHPGTVPGGARVLGFHLEGPFLSPDRPGAHRVDLLRLPSVDLAGRLLSAGPIGQITIAPELEGALDTIEHLVGSGVVVSLGHSTATGEQTIQARERGATAYTHVFNAMPSLHHRESGILATALSGEGAWLTGIFDGVHLSVEAAHILIRCAGDRLVAITDGTAASGSSLTSLHLGGQQAIMTEGAPRLADGTIAGSALTMDTAFRNLVALGLSLPQAAHATSTAPATLAQRPDLGRVSIGAPADVVVLDTDLRVRRTVVGGRIVHESG